MIVWVRRLAVPFVALFVAAGVTGCSSTLSDAATVTFHDSNGTHTVHITRETLQNAMRDELANAQLVSALRSNGLRGDSKNSTDGRLAADYLTQAIRQSAVDGEFHADKLAITSDDETTAREQFIYYNSNTQSGLYPQQIFDAFPARYQKAVVDDYARLAAVFRYYGTCPSGRLVYHLATTNHDDAEAAFNLIRSGKSFETVAREKSVDTTTGQSGGAIGCLMPGILPPEVETVAKQVPFDFVTVPVETRLGYDLVLVRKWTPADSQQYAAQLQQAATAALNTRLKALKVWMNPQFGTWHYAASGPSVIPPAAPNPNLTRDGQGASTTTTTAPTAAAG